MSNSLVEVQPNPPGNRAIKRIVDYFRAHLDAAAKAGFASERGISVRQYWERRRALGILPFGFLNGRWAAWAVAHFWACF